MIEEDRSLDLAMNERGALRELIESRGWKLLMEIADAQRETKINQVIYDTWGMDDLPVKVHTKGEAAGIRLFQLMPQDAIEGLTAEIDEFKSHLEKDDTTFDEENDNATRNAP